MNHFRLIRTAALLLAFLPIVVVITTATSQSSRNIRVRFPRGRTSTVIHNSVLRGTRDNYILGARAGQRMIVHVAAREKNAVFDIHTPGGGDTLAREATDWSGRLPETGDYLISVGGTRGNATYTLELTIR